MKKFLSVLTIPLTALAVLTGAIALPLLVRPFYWAQIQALDIPARSGLTVEQLRDAFGDVMDYCLGLRPDFAAGVLPWSQSGADHFADVRRLLTYLPQNSFEAPPVAKPRPVERSSEIERIVPDNLRRAYDVRAVVGAIFDEDSFLEVQPDFAKNAVIGLARMDGEVVGIVANQPTYIGGSLDCDSSDKMARFIRFCDCFSIPLLTLVDVPAFFPGRDQEHRGIIRHGAKLLYAYSEATVPKITLIMRKAYGGAYIAMNSKNIGADIVYAWPIAEIAVMGAEGAVNILHKREIEAADDPQARTRELMDEYSEKFCNPFIAARLGFIDDVILPGETRARIRCALDMLKAKVKPCGRKHGNIPM